MIIGEYESTIENSRVKNEPKHHEQSAGQQKALVNDVHSFVTEMNKLGNPFTDRTKDLFTIDSQDVMPQSVIDSLTQIRDLGESKYQEFINERLIKNTTPISAIISRNSLSLFRKPKNVSTCKEKQKLLDLKSDCALFSKLCIASQTKEGDIQEFFKHENQKCPPSLSLSEKLRPGNKSDLIRCLETTVNNS